MVIVTGAAHGIGLATTQHLVDNGYRVIATDVSPVLVDRLVDDSDRVQTVVGDLQEPSTETAIFSIVDEKYGGQLYGLVNNATWQRETANMTEDNRHDFDKTIDISLRAPYTLSGQAITRMVRCGGGAIVNMSSVHALYAYPGRPAYDMAKAALLAMTRYIAVEYGPAHIRCNAILPGLILDDGQEAQAYQEQAYPVRRVGRPMDIAPLVAFLLDDHTSGFITGANFVVDGGLSAMTPELAFFSLRPS